MENSLLGFSFDNGEFGSNLKTGKVRRKSIDETYELVVGKVSSARNHCNEMIVPLQEKEAPGRLINLVVRAFNDGVAFRYEFPEQEGWNSYVMYDEKTQFRLNGNPMALLMYLPGYINTHEGVYTHTEYDKIAKKRLIEMPVTLEFDNGIYMSITEAAVRNYAGMYLVKEKNGFAGKLSPRLGQEKIKVEINEFPHRTPWRVLSVADRVGGLLETNILTSLNEPCKIEDTSWIKPCRTTFTWWNGNVVPDSTFSPGNNFETNKYYIDFAARNGLDAHGIYGYAETPWYYDDNFNFGWAGPNADITRPIPCLNMQRIVEYAKSKGVGIHLWVHWRPLYDKLEEAFALYEKWGVKGLMVDFLDRDDQEMIRIQLRRGQRRLQPIELLGQILDGREEFGNVHVERDDGAARDGLAQKRHAVQMPHAAEIKKTQDRADIQHVDQRTKHAEHKDLLPVRAGEALAFLAELRHLLVLAAKDLRDLDAGQILRQVGVNVGGRVLDLAVGPAGELAEDDRKNHDERHKTEHHQRQLIVERQHGDQDAEDDKDVLGQRDQQVREHHRDGVRIVRHAGDELADGNLVQLLVGQ